VGAAGVAMVLSIFLWFGGSRDEGLFVAIWVPPILAFATFIKVSSSRGRSPRRAEPDPRRPAQPSQLRAASRQATFVPI